MSDGSPYSRGTCNCPACGAPHDSTATTCTHCGNRLATQRCGGCTALHFVGARICTRCGRQLRAAPAPATTGSGPCPRCAGSLGRIELGQLEMDECGGCGGVFVGKDVLRRATADREQAAAVTGLVSTPLPRPQEAVRYLRCPSCDTVMNRVNFGRHSGVITDVCRAHGTWFDAGELVAALEYVAEGGLQKTLHREREAVAEERRRLSALVHSPGPAPLYTADDASSAAVVVGLARMLGKIFD